MYTPQYKWNVKNVPILSREQIDTIAEGFLADFQPKALREPQAVDVDGFLEMYLGVTPDYQYLSHNMIYLGMSVFHDTDSIPIYDPVTDRAEYFSAKANTVIFDRRLVDEEKQEHRYRFTGGHEGGHFIFHPPYFERIRKIRKLLGMEDELFTQCHRTDLVEKKKKQLTTDNDWIEWQANQFSSSLLMPKPAVLLLLDDFDLEGFGVLRAVHEMVEQFNVSPQAARNRLSGLGVLEKVPAEIRFFL